MDTSGMSWVIGGLLAVFAIALVIAGATGHAQQLFTGVTGKKTAGQSAVALAPLPGGPTEGFSHLSADQAVAQSLAAIGAAAPSTSSSATPPANPYSGLSGISGVTV